MILDPYAADGCDHWVGRGSETKNSGAGDEGAGDVKGDDGGDAAEDSQHHLYRAGNLVMVEVDLCSAVGDAYVCD